MLRDLKQDLLSLHHPNGKQSARGGLTAVPTADQRVGRPSENDSLRAFRISSRLGKLNTVLIGRR